MCACVHVNKQRRGEGEETERKSKGTREREGRGGREREKKRGKEEKSVHDNSTLLEQIKCACQCYFLCTHTNMRNEVSCF